MTHYPYQFTTNEVRVSVRVTFLEDESSEQGNNFVWAYEVKIENLRKEAVQLLRRYWKIVDAFGHSREVSGEGVIGEQPEILSGSVYHYTSGVPLSTPSGIMGGYYEMVLESGEKFQVTIPTFSLDSPFQNVTIN